MKKKTVYEKLRETEQSPAWNRAGAYIIVKRETGKYVGKVLFKFPKDGAGRLEVFLWDWTNSEGEVREIQHGSAGGYKKTAALGCLKFGEHQFIDQGTEWDDQLKEKGYDVWGVL